METKSTMAPTKAIGFKLCHFGLARPWWCTAGINCTMVTRRCARPRKSTDLRTVGPFVWTLILTRTSKTYKTRMRVSQAGNTIHPIARLVRHGQQVLYEECLASPFTSMIFSTGWMPRPSCRLRLSASYHALFRTTHPSSVGCRVCNVRTKVFSNS